MTHDEERLSSETRKRENEKETDHDEINYNHFTSPLSRPAPPRVKGLEGGGNFANEKSAIEIFGPISLISRTCTSLWPVRREGRHSAADKYNLLFSGLYAGVSRARVRLAGRTDASRNHHLKCKSQ